MQVKRLDALGKEYTSDQSQEPIAANLAYLKLINVPTMFDVGCCCTADPSNDSLILNMIDDKSFKVEREDFLAKGRKFKVEKI